MAIDVTARYALSPDLAVLERDPQTVQIGTEDPRRLLVADAPAGAAAILAKLDGSQRFADVIADHDGDPLLWRALLTDLLDAGFVIADAAPPAAPPIAPHLLGSRLALIHQHGPALADRALRARADAIVIVDGDGPIADRVADLLAASGIGSVHQQSGPAPAPPARHRDVVWRGSSPARVSRPGPQADPALVVLAAPAPPGPARIAGLMASITAHLAISASPTRAVIGPLVLPGRSACLNCIEQYRKGADPGWPQVAATVRGRRGLPATPLLGNLAAAVAAHQALQLVDELTRPDTVDATVEFRSGQYLPHRRPWPQHPRCGCRGFGT